MLAKRVRMGDHLRGLVLPKSNCCLVYDIAHIAIANTTFLVRATRQWNVDWSVGFDRRAGGTCNTIPSQIVCNLM